MNNENILVRHKKKFLLGIVIILILIILCLLKCCGDKSTTGNKEDYVEHVIVSLDRSHVNAHKLLKYFRSLEGYLVDCDEDVANQLEAFSQEFKEAARQYHGLTYVGKDEVVGVEHYHEISKTYDSIASTLDKLTVAIRANDAAQVSEHLGVLKEYFKQLESEGY